MQVAILLYDGMTVLDAIGPYEVLQSVPGVDICFVATTRGEKRADFKRLGLVADYALAEVPHPDILVVPGTPFPQAVIGDPAVLDWIRTAHETATWTTSVCSGFEEWTVYGPVALLRRCTAARYKPRPTSTPPTR